MPWRTSKELGEQEEEEQDNNDEDEVMEDAADVGEDESMEPEAEAEADAEAEEPKTKAEADAAQEDEGEEQGQKVAPQQTQSPRLQPATTAQPLELDVNSLPVWRPYYQLQRRHDGIYLIVKLNHVDPRNVRVQWNEHSGVLRVSGFRLPTQKDLVMSRLSGAPTFGRFEITEQFPRHMLDMESATQQIFQDDTLQIRMPFYVVRRPM
ncbi:unnamed protein product [Phytophthora fragariaefolia]|uniref:Unnamed protein product n=1 Tax=Phytophthora fragariaefolia TaxID=1490495 RepID=A0A9W6YH39_9STRA|nr:unnamed protein product [Phytophthora fragariaefolia]